jgi:exodeoxyribonuclease V gamma subunit
VFEGIDAVEDLDPLELNALERYQLLDQNLEPLLVAGTLPDWPSLLAGQGVMPAGAGAALEQQELADRWQRLRRQLDSLGPCRREGVVIEGVLRPLVFAGETQVVVQAGMLSVRGVMRGWLQHLHLCRLTPTPTAVIARSTRAIGAEIHLHWMALPADQAEEQLVTLQRLAQQGLHQCCGSWRQPAKVKMLKPTTHDPPHTEHSRLNNHLGLPCKNKRSENTFNDHTLATARAEAVELTSEALPTVCQLLLL